jgi:hypothetical protein
MKIGLNIVGISYNKETKKDWKDSNIKQTLIECLNQKYEVETYITTYMHNELLELIKHYDSKITTIIKSDKSAQILTYIKSLKQLVNEDLDVIISTRFDIFFNQNFDELNFDFSKFNFLFKETGWWDNYKFTTDNFYIFPKEYLQNFIECIEELYKAPPRNNCTDMHGMYNFISKKISEDNIHFISDNHMISNVNEFYKLTRFL